MRIIFLTPILMCALQAYAQQDTVSVYFGIGSSAISDAAKHTIDSLMYHDVLAPGRRVGIIGYADMIGDEKSNKDLSVKRAAAVAAYLQYMNIDSQYIEQVTGVGEVQRAENNKGYPQDRRVAIIPGGFDKKATVAKTFKPGILAKVMSGTTDSPIIDLSTIPVNAVFKLDRVYFDFGKDQILLQSIPVMRALAKALQENPTVKIQVEGHVCCSQPYTIDATGKKVPLAQGQKDTTAFTDMADLSVYRAKAVRDYLVYYGAIDRHRIKYIGYGNKHMIASPEVTDEDRAKNRRVEVRIMER